MYEQALYKRHFKVKNLSSARERCVVSHENKRSTKRHFEVEIWSSAREGLAPGVPPEGARMRSPSGLPSPPAWLLGPLDHSSRGLGAVGAFAKTGGWGRSPGWNVDGNCAVDPPDVSHVATVETAARTDRIFLSRRLRAGITARHTVDISLESLVSVEECVFFPLCTCERRSYFFLDDLTEPLHCRLHGK